MFRTLLISLLLFISLFSFGQQQKTAQATNALKVAQRFINNGQFEEAQMQLYETIRIKKDFAVAYRELGKVELELGFYQEAIDAFLKSFELNDNLSRSSIFECGEAYFKSGDFNLAMDYYNLYKIRSNQKFTNSKKESGLETTYDFLQPLRVRSCNYAMNAIAHPKAKKPIRLSNKINSKQDEYLPAISASGRKLLFTRENKDQNENIFVSELGNEKWGEPKSMGEVLNSPMNEGMAQLTPNGKTLFFAGCFREDTEGGCDIYEAHFENDKVDQVIKQLGDLNSEGWDSQPSLNCDGTKIYFASIRAGGFGGSDLWGADKKKDGSWGVPYNLGGEINTPGDEEAPFIASDDRSLFFSSNGHEGLGDGDIFHTKFIAGKWLKPTNLGYPINTQFKEIGFFVDATGKKAYFSSERTGGKGGLDIYSVEIEQNVKPDQNVVIRGRVFDLDTQEPIFTKVSISNQDNTIFPKMDEDGNFVLCLPYDRGYVVQVEKDGYEYYMEAIFLGAAEFPVYKLLIPLVSENRIPEDEPIVEEVQVQPRQLPIREEQHFEVFFDFDKSGLNPSTLETIESVIEILQNDPFHSVQIIGFSDNIGNSMYNQQLSQKRAMAVYNYFLKAGVRVNGMRYEGKGALAERTYTDEENQALNRRVEIVIKPK